MTDQACESEDCGDSLANQVAVLDLGEVRAAAFLVLRLGYYDVQVKISEDAQSVHELSGRKRGIYN